jgi:hypothetical protein
MVHMEPIRIQKRKRDDQGWLPRQDHKAFATITNIKDETRRGYPDQGADSLQMMLLRYIGERPDILTPEALKQVPFQLGVRIWNACLMRSVR